MDRELVFLVLCSLTLGPLLLRAGLQRTVPRHTLDACRLERECWRHLWLPLLPAAIVLASLVGWALLEPDNAERLPIPLVVLGMPFVGVWARALIRAVYGLRRPSSVVTAATVGIIRPRVVIAPRFVGVIDRAAQDAVSAHEAAHVEHRDPLRVWLARLATDLQWPGPAAVRRFEHWRHALELARDEEVRLRGVDGIDLAAAVIAALQFGPVNTRSAVSIADHDDRVRERITRLLAPVSATAPETTRLRFWRLSTLAAPLGAILFGASFGEAIVRALVHAIP